ncbi:MAG TPA: DUF1648 domain-containing protein [Patescibacteria group bacterium]|nr:DUF1648 domain-containing protein [Patescibacteria group bacterium]
MSKRRADRLSLALIVAMFALAMVTWPSAPARIPIHWNISGQVDGYGSKSVGLLLMPIVALAGYALIGAASLVRRQQFDWSMITALSWFRCSYVILMAGVFGVIVADARGANINMNYVIFPVLALMTIASVNLIFQLSRLKSNKTAPPDGGIQV